MNKKQPERQLCNVKYMRLMLIVFLFSAIFLHSHAFAQSNDTLRVMILTSYFRGTEWTEGIMDGIQAEFKDPDQPIAMFVENIEVKQYHAENYFYKLKDLYEYRYSSVKFSVILVSDSYVLQFVKEYGKVLFPGVPVVFCGLDRFDEKMVEGLDGVTGVVEDYDLEETIKMAIQLHPNTVNIAVVSDDSEVGRLDLKRFREIAPKYRDTYHIIEIINWNLEELKRQLRALSDNTFVLRFSYKRTIDGYFLGTDEGGEIWMNNCRVPTYTCMEHGVEAGAVGGIISTPAMHGQVVARMAKRILAGESADDIPVQLHSPSIPMFDYFQLKKFGIRESDLPENAVILNRPFSFYQEYKKLVWSVIAVFLVFTGFIALLSYNIVSRHEAEKALKENEEKYRLLIETIPHGILEIDMAGKITFANSAHLKMLNYSSEELVGKLFYDLIPSKDRRRIKRILEKLEGDMPIPASYQSQYKTKDGSIIDVQFDWNFKRDIDGKITGIISVVSDITEQLRTEEQAKLRQEQLIQADKMAALGTLVSGVAHEVNNPNNFIMLNIPIIIRAWKSILPILDEHRKIHGEFEVAGLTFTKMKQEFPEICSDILEGSRRIKEIVKDLKEYSRKSEIEKPEQVDINEMLRSSINLLANNIQKFTKNFKVNYGENIPRIEGNFQHFEQVVINLLQNACQSLPDKEKAVTVSSMYHEAQKTVEIQIVDEGVGIPAENIGRIYDPFFTTKREQGGTGLGLSISNSIIQKYGGTLRYNSKPGKGTIVCIILPEFYQKSQEK